MGRWSPSLGYLLLIRLLIISQSFLLLACSALAEAPTPVPLSERVADGEVFMGIRLLGTLRLPTEFNGVPLGALSGLAWDEDEGILYAVSDQSKLHHLQPVFSEGLLRDVRHLGAYSLQDSDGRALQRPWSDAEGLTLRNAANGIRGDTELVVSFEIRMRIRRYDNTGKRLGGISLPHPLDVAERYQNINAALESITIHPQWGILVAPERSMRGDPRGTVRIHSLQGQSWLYPLATAPRSSLVAMEALDDGSVVFLERAFTSVVKPLIISIRRGMLGPDGSRLAIEDVAVLNSSQGWLLDNFEGLSHYRAGQFFMVTDDNRHFLQNTLLVLFELLP